MDEEGNLYPVNFNDRNVLKVDPAGNISLFAKIPGSGNGHVHFANGKLYVVGRSANQVFEVSLEGKVSLIAGTGTAGNVDGDGKQASFSVPNGIHTSEDGTKIYVTSRARWRQYAFESRYRPGDREEMRKVSKTLKQRQLFLIGRFSLLFAGRLHSFD